MPRMETLFYKLAEGNVEFVVSQGADFLFTEHSHVSSATFGRVRRGRVVLTRATRTEIRAGGDMYALSPYEPHSIFYERECEVVSLCLDKKFLRTSGGDVAVPTLLHRVQMLLPFGTVSDAEVCAFAEAFHNMRTAKADAWRNALPSAKEFERHPETPVRLRQVAEDGFPNVPYYIRVFKKCVGLTPHRFQVQNRIRYAKRLLETPIAIAEVALTAGFCDQSHLNRCFKKALGMTPRQYREAVRRLA